MYYTSMLLILNEHTKHLLKCCFSAVKSFLFLFHIIDWTFKLLIFLFYLEINPEMCRDFVIFSKIDFLDE